MTVISDLRLLLWKNYILQIRHPFVTVAEILIPCLFAAMLAGIRHNVGFTQHSNVTIYDTFDTNNVPDLTLGTGIRIPYWIVMYSPNTTRAEEVVRSATRKLQDLSMNFQLQGFSSEEQMINYYEIQESYYQNLILCGIVIEDEPHLDDHLKYKLRFPNSPRFSAKDRVRPIKNWWTQFTFPLFSKPGPRMPDHIQGGIPGYWEEGFLALQHSIAMSVASHITNSVDNIDQDVVVLLQRFPYPPYIEDIFLLALQFLFPVILMLSFIYPAVNLTKNLVIEKEKRLKESMKMMGLRNWMHWTAWFIKSFIWLAISSGLLTFLLTLGVRDGVGILNQSNGFLIYFFFISFSISCIAFSFLISTFFSKANVSAVGAGVLFFMAFMPYFAFFPQYRDLSFAHKLLSCVSCNSALAMGSMIIAMWEGNTVGIQWSNLNETASPDDTLTIGIVIIMFYVDTFLYICLTLYIEAVFPGEYGLAQKWYFPLTPSYWIGHKDNEKEEMKQLNDEDHNKDDDSHGEFFEKEPGSIRCGIRIRGLSKTFDGKKYAVKDLSVNAYRGQITALLGHNGAGKTTTMSILTGLFPPSDGTAIVNGYDIRTDIDKVRSSLGICPQFDILFDEMTVEEHLKFFCQLKDFDPQKYKEEIEDMIKLLDLEDKAKKQSKTLSGGQKRKLSIGIALVGRSEIVILDEPTSGMDVYARRFTWDLLLNEKTNRTILLSTHFMEEADILSERIAIMSNGRLQCCGSPLFLKRKYGIGYHMTIVKSSDSTDVQPITRLIQYHIEDAKLETSAGTEVSYSLPHEKSKQFEALFNDIETKRKQLAIDSYGVSITTMEEVFLKVGEYAEEAIRSLNDNHNNNRFDANETVVSINMDPKSDQRNTGSALIGQQFRALFAKKVIYSLRNQTLTASQIFIPMFFAVLVLALIKNLPKLGDSPSLSLNLDNFKGTEVPIISRFTNDSDVIDLVNEYKIQFSDRNRIDEQVFSGKDFYDAMNRYILGKSEQSIGYFNLHVPIGVMVTDNKDLFDPTFQENDLIVAGLFNNQPFHAIAISLAAMDSAIVRYAIGNSNYTVEVSNHPLPRTTADKLLQVRYATPQQYQLSENLMFSISFLAASFSILLVTEKSNKGKHLQKVCGVKLYLFWITSFIWDYLIYLVACLLVMFTYFIFNEEPLMSAGQEARLFVVFATHGLSLLPFVYLLSFLFDVPSTAYVRICLFNIIVGIGTFITVVVTELPLLDLAHIGKVLDFVFSIFIPNFNLGRSVYHLYTNYLGNKYCNLDTLQKACNLGTVNSNDFIDTIKTEFKQFSHLFDDYISQIPPNTSLEIPVPDVIKPCCREKCNDTCFPWNENFFGWDNPGIGRLLTFFILQAIVFWSLIILTEINVFTKIRAKYNQLKINLVKKLTKKEVSEENVEINDSIDSDVIHESKRIDETDLTQLIKTDSLIIKRLVKYYGQFLAVDHISYGVRKGECFGLLGVNGAGKTTTFKMITGDESISSGDIYVNGYSVKQNIQKVQQQIGYCPQFDGLLDQLTGRETLVMFCRLRGIKEQDIYRHVIDISKLLYFDMHLDKMVRNYSGGTKRKLSTAVALLGDPLVSFLDEPTTGVDPVARRCLWDALTKKLSEGRSLVLTSHSMEECEALCNRLIIMVNGKICCIGSPQQLKNKFGNGYTVRVKVSTGLSQTNSLGERRHSKIAWRDNSITSYDIVLEQNIKQTEDFMLKSFEGTQLKEVHYNVMVFQINDTSISWSRIFGIIERAKESLNIEDYSVGQTTLEQIFLAFAAKQRDRLKEPK